MTAGARHPGNTAIWRLLLLGWLGHMAGMLLVGGFQQDYRALAGTLLNTPLMWLAHSLQSPGMDRWMVAVSGLGEGNLVAVLTVPILLVLWLRRRRRAAGMVAAAMLGSALMAGIAKLVIHSARPQLWQSLEHASGSSFPSSHASGSMSLALTLVLLMPESMRLILGIPVIVLAALVGFSRVYLGVHAPTDIVLTWWLVLSWILWVKATLSSRQTPDIEGGRERSATTGPAAAAGQGADPGMEAGDVARPDAVRT